MPEVLKGKILLFLICFVCKGCSLFKYDPKPKTELEKLPPITQVGKNTFSCLVNGKAFIPNNTVFMSAVYQGGGIQISGTTEAQSINQNILMVALDPLANNVEYSLTNLPYHKAMFSSFVEGNDCIYEFDTTTEGSIIFSKIDRVNYIVSGTFQFSAMTAGCKTITVTDGRFDMQYVP